MAQFMEEIGRDSASEGYVAGYLQDATGYSENYDEVVWLYVVSAFFAASRLNHRDAAEPQKDY